MKSVVLFSILFLGLAIATVEGDEAVIITTKKQISTLETIFPEPTTPELTTTEPTTLELTTTEPTTPEPTIRVPDAYQLAERCNEDLCKLPDCRCSSFRIPGDLLPKDTPQFVTITFDDGVNIRNIETYREVLYGRKNSDGCPAGATFYVTHEYTNYRLVNELYNQGYEIALNSISHRVPQDYWATASYNDIKEEIVDQRLQMAHFANIPIESIKGVRLPFLQLSGNTSFQVMADYGLEYDCSWTETVYRSTLWPYTLDYASIQFCVRPPCPTASIPKVWVQPMVAWIDQMGNPCAMADSCHSPPDLDDEDGWYDFIVTNFRRHYLGNRAPFGFYVHEWYLSSNPAVKAAFIRFMDLISSLSDAFMVNSSEVIDWIKNPMPVSEYRTKGCRTWSEASCWLRQCGPLSSQHNEMHYYMQSCNTCPRVYPWTGNPLGTLTR